MRVYIGPHRTWVSPYQIAEALCFWVPKKPDKYGSMKHPEWVHAFGKFLSEDKNGNPTLLNKVCEWIESKKKRKIRVKIHPYDSWNIDGTLAPIIYPLLKQLRDTSHSSAIVDPEDVPYELRVDRYSDGSPQKLLDFEDNDQYISDSWKHVSKQWDYVLGEMIWAFEQIQPGYDWEEQYRSGEIDVVWEPNFGADGKTIVSYTMGRGPKDTYTCDYDALLKHSERMRNGFRLFGKYYQNLWD